MDDRLFFASKVAALEFLVQNLYIYQFAKAPDPASALARYAEDMRTSLEQAPVPEAQEIVGITMQEQIAEFFQAAISRARKREAGG